MDAEVIATIITSVLAIISTLLAAKYNQGKTVAETKAGQLCDVLKDVVNMSDKVFAAAKDDRVDEAEFQAIADAANKIVLDAKLCFSKTI